MITEPTGTFSVGPTRALSLAFVAIAIGCRDAAIAPRATTASFDGGFTEDVIALDGFESGGVGQHHLVYNTTLASSPPNASAFEQLIDDDPTASQTGTLELSYEGHTFTDESVSTGTEIKFDGSLYARVLFPQTINDTTHYLKPDGTPLSQHEIADLNALLDRVLVANFSGSVLRGPND